MGERALAIRRDVQPVALVVKRVGGTNNRRPLLCVPRSGVAAIRHTDQSPARSPRHRRAVSPQPVHTPPASPMRTHRLQHLARRPLSTSAVSRHENPLVRIPLVSLHCPRSLCPGPSAAQCSTPASDAPQRRRPTPKAVHPACRRRPRCRQRQGRRRQEHRSRSARPSPSAPGATSLTRALASEPRLRARAAPRPPARRPPRPRHLRALRPQAHGPRPRRRAPPHPGSASSPSPTKY